jgi:Uma2 family endonuclease
VRHLLLAVEVVSPASWRSDHLVKCRLYRRHGVPHYWIVDADQRAVYQWTPDASEADVATRTLTWQPAGAATALTISLQELFRPV